jgi:limonene-1,2-epoxide hydrolase
MNRNSTREAHSISSLSIRRSTFAAAMLFVVLIHPTLREQTMAQEAITPLETVKRFMIEVERMDFDAATSYLAESFEYIPGPVQPVALGAQGFREALEPFFAPIEENEIGILRESANGGTVFLERLDRHRIPQGWFELPVTGVYEVEDGKITFMRDYYDLATIQNAMQALMEK